MMRKVVLIAAATALMAVFAGMLLPGIRLAFSAVCHQSPARSVGALPVCARCLGLYGGLLAAGLVPLPVGAAAAIAAVAANAVPTAANWPRFGLGFALGWLGGSYLIRLAVRERALGN